MSRRRQQPNPPTSEAGDPIEHDVLIIGAGIAGINTAYRLKTNLPHLTFTILEARPSIGGTWDIFRYPGVRSDSDMYTYGFAWHPWRLRALGEGEEIMAYLREAVAKHGLDDQIKLNHKVVGADWSSDTKRWTVRVEHGGKTKSYVSRWLVHGTGAVQPDRPFPAVIPGIDNFKGQVLHPQFWPADRYHDDSYYKDKKVVIIGSGSTAITLLPALVERGAAKVTMLQRSPSHVASIPNPETIPAGIVGRLLPLTWLVWLRRLMSHALMWLIHFTCANFPSTARRSIQDAARRQLPAHIPVDPHFDPSYNPWDQRLCLAKEGDFFAALRGGKADVVTGTIKTVTPGGIKLDDGSKIDADVIVTATGWILRFGGGIPVSVDGGGPVAWHEKLLWNRAMAQDVPNMFFMWGYTNVSWTLGVDTTATIMCRVIQKMEGQGARTAVPRTAAGGGGV